MLGQYRSRAVAGGKTLPGYLDDKTVPPVRQEGGGRRGGGEGSGRGGEGRGGEGRGGRERRRRGGKGQAGTAERDMG